MPKCSVDAHIHARTQARKNLFFFRSHLFVAAVVAVVDVVVVETSKKNKERCKLLPLLFGQVKQTSGVHEIPTHSQRAKATQM